MPQGQPIAICLKKPVLCLSTVNNILFDSRGRGELRSFSAYPFLVLKTFLKAFCFKVNWLSIIITLYCLQQLFRFNRIKSLGFPSRWLFLPLLPKSDFSSQEIAKKRSFWSQFGICKDLNAFFPKNRRVLMQINGF